MEESRLRVVWEASYLARLPAAAQARILDGAVPATVPAKAPIYPANTPSRLALVEAGLARVFVVSREGRKATLRYARHGQVIGLPSVLAGSSPEGAEAVTDTQVFLLNARAVRELARADAQVCWALAQQAAAIAFETADVLGASLFGTVRQSLGRHLLDLASSDGDSLFVEIEHQELADMIGTVREVVSRTLRQLQDEGLVRRDGHRITILDTDRLSRGL